MSSDGAVVEPAQAAANNQAPANNQAQQRGWGATLRAMLFQMLIFYAISSFFRSSRPPSSGGQVAAPGKNMFSRGQEMELYVFLSEDDNFTDFHNTDALIWCLDGIKFGSWSDGPNEDGSRVSSIVLNVPESVQNNGTWYLHVYLTKQGISPNPNDSSYHNNSVVYQRKLLTSYKQRRINNKVNLLTGTSEALSSSEAGKINSDDQNDQDAVDIISYWHPNLTISVVDDQSPWQQGSIPPPLDKYIEFDNKSGNYWPVLYLNDYWNLARDYQPVNDTTKSLDLHLTYQPLSVFRFQMYVAISNRNNWWDSFGQQDHQSDEEQDTLKETLMDTNPYLLAITMVVTLLHTVFEFLAFKNDVQFWRSRRSLEGLSARSVLFGVFQSVIVFLYILDNDTNMIVIISVFISLLIDCWKITKVLVFTLDRENPLLGVIPRLQMTYKSSYNESPTKQYDMLAFKYLSWVLFPLFLSYGVYSLMYHEHKGWYSFILSMSYGFLLTFGFIMMTPQLFINYKLKSVAHLPWRMLTYKALNTFIDDMFAFVIKMPFLYRIGCFRDDVVFFIYLYQRWIYPMDPHRVNEYGTSADDQPAGVGGAEPSVEGVATVDEPASSQSSDSELSLDGNVENNEIRRRLLKSED